MRALGFLHAAWGLGAAIGPIIVTAFVAGGRTWRLAFVPVVLIQSVLLCAYVVVRKDWKILLVDISGLHGMVGSPPSSRDTVALDAAAVILDCWSGD